MKFMFLLAALVIGAASCTTLSNRRDLYNPSEDVRPDQSLQQKSAEAPEKPALRGELPPAPQ